MNYRILLLGILCFITPYLASSQANTSSFSFTINQDAKTSAGVFKSDGTLIKTLWSNVHYKAGNYSSKWDGTTNDYSEAPDDSYEIRILSNNIQAQWGIAGNTSAAISGSTVSHSADVITSMCFAGKYCYYSVGYNEGPASHFKFNIDKPQEKTEFLPGTGQATLFEATDGINVYHAGMVTPPQEFIFATKVNDDTEFTFANGTTGKHASGRTYTSVIDITSSTITSGSPENPRMPECSIGGLAVQKNGKYLFVSHYDRNELRVYDKITGALVQTIRSFVAPKSLAVDANDNVWVISGNGIVSKHVINPDGTFSAAVITLQGLIKPLCVTVNPTGELVAVADGGKKQQVRFFNTSTGAEGVPLGQEGGYATDPNVAPDKFMFKNTKEFFKDERNTFVSFGLDGSIWVGDRGNYRVQHFSSSHKFEETLMNIGYFYSAGADKNDPTRVFANYLEFKIDYSKPLASGNGSWTLVKNWAYPITYEFDNGGLYRLVNITTLNNGRTYALQPHRYVHPDNTFWKLRWHLVELPSSGNMIFTGIEPEFTGDQFDVSFSMNPDGSLLRTVPANPAPGYPFNWVIKKLTGFDGSGKPLWGPDEILASVPALGLNDAVSIDVRKHYSVTSTGKIISFCPDVPDPKSGLGAGNHLGAIAIGGKDWLWQTSPSTHIQYKGSFPDDGYFDIGNGTNYPGGPMMTVDSFIVWGHHGEFWKGSQTNKWNLYSDNGLMLMQFGTTGPEAEHIGEAAPEMAGNAISGSLCKLPDGDMVLVSADESYHGALQMWRIKGLNTVQEQKVAINKNRSYGKQEPDYTDLMAGLPFDQTVSNNTYGWTRSPDTETVNGFENTWSVKTNSYVYKRNERDVTITSFPPDNNLTQTVKRELGSNNQLKNWKICGEISYPIISEIGENFIDILDNNDRVIVRISRPFLPDLPAYTMAIKANNTTLVQGTFYDLEFPIGKLQPLIIKAEGVNSIKVAYGDYPEVNVSVFDPQADWQNPTTLRFQMHNDDRRGHAISAANLKFYKNINTVQSTSYRTRQSGNWGDNTIWQSTEDGINWVDAEHVPDSSAGSIVIQNGHTVSIIDSAIVDQLTVQDGGVLVVSAGASMSIHDGPNDDVIINQAGSLVIKSDASGTGRISYSTGNVVGNVTVEKFVTSNNNASYRVLSPSVNTAGGIKPSIRDNWQEGQNNTQVDNNINVVPQYGIHITGSYAGENGFDATHSADPSMFTFDQISASQHWVPIPNTISTPLTAKTGYAIYISGDRGVNINDPNSTSNTTLRATGKLLTGTQVFAGLEGNGRISLVTNPYASPINWNNIYYDPSTNHTQNFYDYCYYWDPNIGSAGGYVSVKSDGVKSTASGTDMDIQAGEVFFIRAKEGVVSPSLTIKESHKSSGGSSIQNFKSSNSAQLMVSLGFKKPDNSPITADGVNMVFGESYATSLDGDDVEEIPNTTENIAILKSGKRLSIESRPLATNRDTVKLIMERVNTHVYFWKFQPNGFTQSNYEVFLIDRFLNTRTPISLSTATIVSFEVNTSIAASSAQDRFQIVMGPASTSSLKISSAEAKLVKNIIEVKWTVDHETNIQSYIIEKSTDGKQFVQAAVVSAKAQTASLNNEYNWTDKYPSAGTNYYRIKASDQLSTVQYSKIMDVKLNEQKVSFDVYPNPVPGNTFVIQFNNIPAGNYKLKLINNTGLVIYANTIAHAGGSNVQAITVGENFSTGSYTLLINGNGVYYSKQLLK